MSNISSLDELAAALNDRQITDGEGQIDETTSTDDTAAQEENTENESVTAEKSEDELEESTQDSEDESETQHTEEESEDSEDESQDATDESGKRYVPESRFKKVYAKSKELERQIEALQAQTQSVKQPKGKQSKSTDTRPSKADLLELKLELPQFDPKLDEYGEPTNPEYSPELDRLGAQILRANPGMSPLQAGREALKVAKELSKRQAQVKSEAHAEKSIRSDTGITSRVQSKDLKGSEAEKVLNSNDDQEMEAYLKKIGQW